MEAVITVDIFQYLLLIFAGLCFTVLIFFVAALIIAKVVVFIIDIICEFFRFFQNGYNRKCIENKET